MQSDNSQLNIRFGTHEFILDAAGALYWPKYKTLVISDLHFEKGSYFAERMQLLPLYDTRDTLQRVERLLNLYQPDRLICLGDNFHDKNALLRMQQQDFDQLIELCHSVNEWIWIVGNHDAKELADNPLSYMRFEVLYRLDDIIFTHEFIEDDALQIGGHFHPKISIAMNNNKITGKCFMTSMTKIIMPAFGTYTGGLNASNPIFETTLNTSKFNCYLFYRNVIKRVK